MPKGAPNNKVSRKPHNESNSRFKSGTNQGGKVLSRGQKQKMYLLKRLNIPSTIHQ